MKILVIGGTGTVGSHVVRGLLQRKQPVRVMTSSAEKARTLVPGVEGAVANLDNPGSLSDAFEGVDAAFLVLALAQNETPRGLAAVGAAKTAGVKRLVYVSVAQAERAKEIPHFATKVPIEQAVRASGSSWTILRPNNFFQNDLWLKDILLGFGVYPQPIGDRGIERIDVRDIADAAVNALTSEAAANTVVEMHGPDLLTGSRTAQVYASNLGKPVQYGGNDLDLWGKHQEKFLPAWLIEDLKIMYKYFQDHGLNAAPGEAAAMRELLGHAPRTFEDFATELCRSWKTK